MLHLKLTTAVSKHKGFSSCQKKDLTISREQASGVYSVNHLVRILYRLMSKCILHCLHVMRISLLCNCFLYTCKTLSVLLLLYRLGHINRLQTAITWPLSVSSTEQHIPDQVENQVQ